ncbi:MAG TPA: cation:proton antiporter [Synergistaceae bacterium]|jgi:multicomponent Na+:H+ antiporter subunit G|nr:MAG: Monovalent cation/proton antiporter, MnhG/PhaG subunit [Synergistales bacterium 53_16]KUL03987.1 MAG: Monovalent cation/proton antiporter, MnhG/PhaG subunit [Synergistales bacterium 54_9]MDK2846144.1 multicomponent Na+:H+ antiporter subunit [Synergistales bacterium]HAA47633.1 cation:proton antiporter [Synergistaceae bacterium]MDN5335730.1 multicomponent Na+:H+ antiporter subunit [Synergistales bacterium]
MTILIVFFLVVGVTFNLLGTIALFRFPDVFTRLHGTTKCTTFGSIFTSGAVILFAIQKLIVTGEGRFVALAVHVALAIFALLITNPTGAHAIARAAHKSGVLPKFAVVDRLAEDEKKKDGV